MVRTGVCERVRLLVSLARWYVSGFLAGFPTDVSMPILVSGASLTLVSTVTVFGDACNVVSRTHTSVVCTMQGYYGVGIPVVVTAAGQSSAPFYIDMDPPVVTSILPLYTSQIDAFAGSVIQLFGSNFGRNGKVYVNTQLCSNVLFSVDEKLVRRLWLRWS